MLTKEMVSRHDLRADPLDDHPLYRHVRVLFPVPDVLTLVAYGLSPVFYGLTLVGSAPALEGLEGLDHQPSRLQWLMSVVERNILTEVLVL
jgi:hypothetical protein